MWSFKPFSYWSSSSVHHPETFPYQNSCNHENCYIKFSSNTFSDQITICQFLFEIFGVKQIDSRAKKLSVCVSRPSALGPYLWPSTLGPSALGPQNIAGTNPWIKHITYSRLYLFKVKTYLFKIFKKLFRKAKLRCPK